jgi:pimeloyl-ACP methyl ester carboxylesterase
MPCRRFSGSRASPTPRVLPRPCGRIRRGDPKTVSPEFLNPPSEGEAIEAAAARVNTPVVLVRGEHSDVVTDESVRRFLELKPQLIVLEAKGVGHMFTGDRNDVFAVSLLEYLARFVPLDRN